MESDRVLENLLSRLEASENPLLNRFFGEISSPAVLLEGQDIDNVRNFLQHRGVLNVFRVIWRRRNLLANQVLNDTGDLNLEKLRQLQGRAQGLLEAIAYFTLVFEDQEQAVEDDNGRATAE